MNRYPLPRRRHGCVGVGVGARLDIARLGMMCMKAAAAGKKCAVRAGTENGVVGGGGALVFLRRNQRRVKRRLGADRK